MGSLAPEFPLLGLLWLAPSHGYALHLKLNDELGELWTISQSQTYNILKRLEKQGFVEGRLQNQQVKRGRYQLRLTQRGQAHFQHWLLESTNPSSQALRVEFLSRLYFARHLEPASLDPLVRAQIHRIRTGLEAMAKRLAEQDPSKPINRWALEIRLAQIQGFLDWLIDNHDIIVNMQSTNEGVR